MESPEKAAPEPGAPRYGQAVGKYASAAVLAYMGGVTVFALFRAFSYVLCPT